MPVISVWRGSADKPVVDVGSVFKGGGSFLRIGAYGDPAAAPFELTSSLVDAATAAGVRRRSGYTHLWHRCDPRFSQLLMASCEGTLTTLHAQRMGWRTFTVQPVGVVGEGVLCPASDLAGHKSTCERCGLCDGVPESTRPSVWIPIHGSNLNNKTRRLDAILKEDSLAS